MGLTQMVAFAVVAAVLAVFLKESHPAMAMVLTGVAAAMLLLSLAVNALCRGCKSEQTVINPDGE